MQRATERKIRVIVIDDDPDMLFFVKTLFSLTMPKTIRVNTTTHISWERAVSNWDEVAVAIVDILMPVSGLQILEEIKEKYPHVERIAWTAAEESVKKEIEDKCLGIVIPKPNHEELRTSVLGMV